MAGNMESGNVSWFRRIARAARPGPVLSRAGLRFPVTIALLTALCIVMSVSYERDFAYEWIAITLGGAALASLAATLAVESRRAGIGLCFAAAVLAAAVFAVPLFFFETFDTYRLAYLSGLAFAVSASPFLLPGHRSDFLVWLTQLDLSIIFGLLSGLVTSVGLAGSLLSLHFLFDIDVPFDIFFHVSVWSYLFVAPLFALSRLSTLSESEADTAQLTGDDSPLLRGAAALFNFTAAILLCLYLAILHAYAIRIAISGELPESQVGSMVLAALIALFLTLLVGRRIVERFGAPWTKLLDRFWPALMIVPLGLLFIALYARVDAYGWTVPRYFLTAAGIVGTLYAIWEALGWKPRDLRQLPVLTSIVLLIGAFGPWGAWNISMESQAERFREMARAAADDPEANDQAMRQLNYLSAQDELARVALQPTEDGHSDVSIIQIVRQYDLDPQSVLSDTSPIEPTPSALETTIQTIGDYDNLIASVELRVDTEELRIEAGETIPEMSLSLAANDLVIRSGERTVRFSLETEEGANASGVPPFFSESRSLLSADGEHRIMIIPFAESYANVNGAQWFHGSILLRSDDW